MKINCLFKIIISLIATSSDFLGIQWTQKIVLKYTGFKIRQLG